MGPNLQFAMLGRVCNLLSLVALSAVTIATPAVAQLQPTGSQPPPSGSARLTGRVIAADNSRPVRRAYVRLSGAVSRTVETDVEGRFDFADLPAGWYTIDVYGVSGFVWLAPAKQVTLTEGQRVDVTVRLERSGAIEGRIKDEHGDGLPGMQVHAVRRLTVGGYTTQLTSAGSATTDDRGDFRLFNLRAGDYYVVASYVRGPGPIVSHGQDDPVPVSGYANTYIPALRRFAAPWLLQYTAGETASASISRSNRAGLPSSPSMRSTLAASL